MRTESHFRQKASTGCNSKPHNHLLTTEPYKPTPLSVVIINNAVNNITAHSSALLLHATSKKSASPSGSLLCTFTLQREKVTVMNGASKELSTEQCQYSPWSYVSLKQTSRRLRPRSSVHNELPIHFTASELLLPLSTPSLQTNFLCKLLKTHFWNTAWTGWSYILC